MMYDSNEEFTNSPPNYDKDLAKGEKAEKNTKIHQRINELVEKKRLKELLDDSNDWNI